MRRRDLLTAGAALAAFPRIARGGAPRGPKHLIVVLAYGGWDPTFAFDPKLGVGDIEGPEWFNDPTDPLDVELVQTVNGIPLALNERRRPWIRRFFETWGKDSVVLNGLYTASIVHDPCKIRVLTGSRRTDAPDLSVIVGATHGTGPLGSVDMSGRGQAGSLAVTTGLLGEHQQIKGLLEPLALPAAAPQLGVAFPQLVPTASDEALLGAFLRGRAQRYAAQRPDVATAMAELTEAWDRADLLLEHDDFGLLLGRNTEPVLRDQIDLTLSVLTTGVAHSVLLDDRLTYWDTHPSNETQHEKFDALFENLDVLARALVAADLWEDTRILVVSEMGRTPRHNANLGKDHWPYTSALWYGGGVRGGRVIGATDDAMLGLPVDVASGERAAEGLPVYYDSFAAGVLQALDVDPAEWLPGVTPLGGLEG